MKMPRRITTSMVAASLATSLAVAPAQAQSLSHTALATSTGLGSSAVNTVIGGPRVGIGGKRATQIRHVRLGKLPAHRLTQGEHT